jgi:hypothetical protein
MSPKRGICPVFRFFVFRLRLRDYASAAGADHFVANFRNMADCILKHHRRKAISF